MEHGIKVKAALIIVRKALEHEVPSSCWATGPMTGDPFLDYVICPRCRAIKYIDNALRLMESDLQQEE
jgi:hypothetical protein